MGLLQRPSPGRPLIAALTYPRRMKYIKSRKQRPERNATAVTFRAPPQRAHLRAVLAAAGGARGRPGAAGRGAAGPGRDRDCPGPGVGTACFEPSDPRRAGAGSQGMRLGRPLGCVLAALPSSPPDVSN